MNLIIPSERKDVKIQLKGTTWATDRQYRLGWRFCHFLFCHSTSAFLKGLRAFLDAPLIEQNKSSPPGFNEDDDEPDPA